MLRAATVRVARHLGTVLGGMGAVGLIAAFALRPDQAGSAAAQDWSPFVLVAGLLLIGLVAADDGLFDAGGYHLGRVAQSGLVLFIGVAALVGAVTAVLNLDTSVAFLTPVVVAMARSRNDSEAPLLYGCLLLSNAGSLFLPGSNLTNLIVVGDRHLSGAAFLSHMWGPALAALVVTAAVIAVVERRSFKVASECPVTTESPVVAPQVSVRLGLVAIGVVVALVVVLPSPALPVALVAVLVVSVRVWRGQIGVGRVAETLGVPVLVGLFGLAVALGTVGRVWSGPESLLSHLDVWGTALVAAVCSVTVNNLPAASLLASRPTGHPYALLVGLNLGPNLFVTGSLAWILWLRVARMAGAQPSIARASQMGAIAVPLSVAAALGLLVLSGSG